jgi:molybdate transport system regulatory protein
MFRLRLHVHVGERHSIGPGKVALLEAIRTHGSISAAARELGMAYRHAWDLVDDLNSAFRSPVVERTAGGRRGGGARLTPLGRDLVRRFRAFERAAQSALRSRLGALEPELRAPRRAKPRTPR